jgi:hypothetical protein
VILQIFTDIRGIDNYLNTDIAQMVCRPYPGKHEKLWRIEHSPRKDDFLRGSDGFSASEADAFHTDCPSTLHYDSAYRGANPQIDITAPDRRAQESGRGTMAATLIYVRLAAPEAFLLFAVIIFGIPDSRGITGLNPGFPERVSRFRKLCVQRAIAAAPGILATLP